LLPAFRWYIEKFRFVTLSGVIAETSPENESK